MNHFYNKAALVQGNVSSIFDVVLSNFPKDELLTFVELGSSSGCNMAYMIVETINKGLNVKFYAIDHWKGTPSEDWTEFLKLCRRNDLYFEFLMFLKENNVLDRVVPIRMTTDEACEIFEDNSIDFLYEDADHTYKSVLSDLNHWYKKVKNSGVICGDDFHYPSVEKAVCEYFYSIGKTFTTMRECNKWLHFKNQNMEIRNETRYGYGYKY
jgi:hypothetical protein